MAEQLCVSVPVPQEASSNAEPISNEQMRASIFTFFSPIV
jgi:hypothetical protein